MSKQIVINSDDQKTRIAIVESGELAELFIETEQYERTLGSLFLGRVRRIMPSIQAAFVDIGQKSDAFLHFSDLSDNLPDWLAFVKEERPSIGRFVPSHVHSHKGRKRRRPTHARRRDPSVGDEADDPEDELEMEESGDDTGRGSGGGHHAVDARSRGRRKSAQRRRGGGTKRKKKDAPKSDHGQDDDDGPPPHSYLQRDQTILVKISKEPIAHKGSRVSTDVSLAGRFLVLVPMANYVAVSKKIGSFKERRRLRTLAKSLLPDGFGVIVRTVAEGQTAKSLDTDLRLLVDRWRKIEERIASVTRVPSVVHEDVNMVSSIIRDLFSENYERILIDSPQLYRNVKTYIQAVAPDMVAGVQLHRGREPVFRAAGIEKKVAEAFERRVNMPGGGYLFIEQTEAMHVIDVNSGRAGRGMSQEDSSLKVNLEAARMIARQVRLRDLGGIIVVDFIDLREERTRRKVYEELRSEFRRDRAVTKVLPMSDFGIVQITRQRLRPSITTTYSGPQGSIAGEETPAPVVESGPLTEAFDRPEALLKSLDAWIRAYRASGRRAAVRLLVHPLVAAFLNRRLPGQSTRWYLRHGLRVHIEAKEEQDPRRYRILDKKSGNDITVLPLPEAPAVPKEEPSSSADRPGRRDGRSRDGSAGSDRRGRGSSDRRGGSSSRRDDDSSDRRGRSSSGGRGRSSSEGRGRQSSGGRGQQSSGGRSQQASGGRSQQSSERRSDGTPDRGGRGSSGGTRADQGRESRGGGAETPAEQPKSPSRGSGRGRGSRGGQGRRKAGSDKPAAETSGRGDATPKSPDNNTPARASEEPVESASTESGRSSGSRSRRRGGRGRGRSGRSTRSDSDARNGGSAPESDGPARGSGGDSQTGADS